MPRFPPERLAQIAITVLFAVDVRTVAEYYRLRSVLGPERAFKLFEAFIPGLLGAVLATAVAVLFYFTRRFRLVVWAAGLTLIALLIYRVVAIPY